MIASYSFWFIFSYLFVWRGKWPPICNWCRCVNTLGCSCRGFLLLIRARPLKSTSAMWWANQAIVFHWRWTRHWSELTGCVYLYAPNMPTSIRTMKSPLFECFEFFYFKKKGERKKGRWGFSKVLNNGCRMFVNADLRRWSPCCLPLFSCNRCNETYCMSCICLIYIYWLLEISLSTFKLWIRCAWGTPHFGYSPVVFTFLPGLTLNEPFLFVEIIWKNGHWFPISFFRKMVSNIHRARPRKQKQAKLVDWIWMNGVNANTQAHTHTKKQTNKKQETRKKKSGEQKRFTLFQLGTGCLLKDLMKEIQNTNRGIPCR